MDDGVGLAY